jgi:hypothetical protein
LIACRKPVWRETFRVVVRETTHRVVRLASALVYDAPDAVRRSMAQASILLIRSGALPAKAPPRRTPSRPIAAPPRPYPYPAADAPEESGVGSGVPPLPISRTGAGNAEEAPGASVSYPFQRHATTDRSAPSARQDEGAREGC